MHLFDEIERVDLRPKTYGKPSFNYFNETARPAFSVARQLLEGWFARYPSRAKAELRMRFRSSIDGQHISAFFELYLHELFSRCGFDLEPHPSVRGSRNRPDFLAYQYGRPCFYLEAALAGLASAKEQAAGARCSVIYDLINQIDSPNFFLNVNIHGAPASSPPTKRLRKQIAKWLVSLDPEEIAVLYSTKKYDSIPSFVWNYEGMKLTLRPIPRSHKNRGKKGIRTIGLTGPIFSWLDAKGAIREAIEGKATKYGSLELPFLLALNVIEDHCDKTDVVEALFGDETLTVSFDVDNNPVGESWSRSRNGAWMGPTGARKRTVSGILVAQQLIPWSMRVVNPEVYRHPWAFLTLPEKIIPLPQWTLDESERRLMYCEGTNAADILRIPMPWPPKDD